MTFGLGHLNLNDFIQDIKLKKNLNHVVLSTVCSIKIRTKKIPIKIPIYYTQYYIIIKLIIDMIHLNILMTRFLKNQYFNNIHITFSYNFTILSLFCTH